MKEKNPFNLDVVSVRLVKDAPIMSGHPITKPEDAVLLLGKHLCEMDREVLCVINMKTDGTPINCHFASIGCLNESMAHPREIFKASILSNAATIMLMHNHPSGNLTPSKHDTMMTDRMSSNNEVVGPPYEILSQKALEHYKQLKEKGENVYIDKLTYEEFMMIGDKELGWRFQMLDEQEQKDRFNAEQGQELEYSEESEITDKRKELPKIDGKDTILRRMAQWEFTKEQQEEAQKAMIVGVPENKILEYFYPDVEVEEMRQVRENFEKASA